MALVHVLIGALQIEIGHRMLEHEDSDRDEDDPGCLLHRRYLPMGFGGPVPVGRGGFCRK